MEHQSVYLTPDIKVSSYVDKLSKTKIMFDHHMLVWFIAGETRIVQADTCYTFKAGDIFLIPRNQPATIINYPTNHQPHKTVVMHLSTVRLRAFYAGLNIKASVSSSGKIRRFQHHPLLESCFASLLPYFELKELPEDIATIKITEAISILRLIDADIDGELTNFELPGRMDLVDFMERNYMFNMPLERFSYLTGRSLSTFKRDFKKAFDISPQRWLTQKRLELAYVHFTEKKLRPADVYFQVGFENLSHFSYAFKKHFGYTPTDLIS
ncbi:helix-turn-helix domain-containing protein [Chitinophaga pinensis]|uniref:Transcriptional regulator, AraC family n=1 Tax=Chitinophaga pinensis (strain ATCC 43595 / DSM 2588 / LMG 13176 / NBRC 15968 / NCIMB 11800 / UQM 2034) TaxID=485918 RepID=A0A979GA13_CHIPD|nr:AraC family transcriptional regulator [Chitinophaga pinensis]ACU63432.1 transcriptional regulator, AraC family [Chitinophaga pinensis DSM 2588]